MKLEKIKLSELAKADLNEREMFRLLGGGDPGCCQCGCHGPSTTGDNDSANDAGGLTSDPEATTPCDTPAPPPVTPPVTPPPPQKDCNQCIPLDVPCKK
jgi:natural product precursor